MKERMNEYQQAVGYLLTSKELPESHVTWVTSVPILVFHGLCVLELETMYATDRQTSDTHDCLMPPTLMAGHNNESSKTSYHWYQKCVSPCGETTFSPQGHLLRTRYPIRKKHRYHRCVCPCGETTYFPHKTILYARISNKC